MNDELASLHQNPYFQILIKKINEDFSIQRFNPNDNRSTDDQRDRWIFNSGREFERDRILTLLGVK